jgi:hypothetical protein
MRPSEDAATAWTYPNPLPKVTFGIIVLNGEPFTRYCLRAIYPFAHEIIVVEGGHEDTRAVATADGHSVDSTLDTIRRFCAEEDPEHKVTLVTIDGFWPKRDEFGRDRTAQSRAYAERATGDYLWQVDIDEFYLPGDIRRVLEMLAEDPEISGASFRQLSFWGSPSIQVHSWRLRRGLDSVSRLFRWGPGYRYVTHEPPTVIDAAGNDLRGMKWIGSSDLERRGIYLYHYSLLFPWQVEQKSLIYKYEKPGHFGEIVEWADTCYSRLGRPYRVHNLYQWPSWLAHYRGEHPPEVERMMEDITAGRVEAVLRDNDDAERLLGTWWYRVGAFGLSYADYLDRAGLRVRRFLHRAYRAPKVIVRRMRAKTARDPEERDNAISSGQ